MDNMMENTDNAEYRCPRCGSNHKQFLGEIPKYRMSAWWYIFWLLFTWIGVFFYIIYANIQKHKYKYDRIKYLCLDCNTIFYANLNTGKDKKKEKKKRKKNKQSA